MKKKLFKITGIVILCLALGGVWGYNKYFKPSPEIQQQLNNEFGTDFFSFDDEKIVNPTQNNENSNDNSYNNPVNPLNPLNPISSANSDNDEGHTAQTLTPEQGDTAAAAYDEINNKHEAQLSSLQSVALGRLDTLYAAAVQEYKQSKKDGTFNRSKFAQKYLQAARTLEANMDENFFGTLNAMQAELNANNFSTEIIGVYKKEYEKAKSAKRSQLLAKARN